MLLSIGSNVIYGMNHYGDGVKHPVLYGIFNTQKFILNKDTLPPLTTDTTRWRRIALYGESARIYFMNDSVRSYKVQKDEKKKILIFSLVKDSTNHYFFNYTLSKDSVLQLKGNDPYKHDVSATLKRYNEQQFLLLRRGFHFVNEKPLNK